MVPSSLKQKLVQLFCDSTSKGSLSEVTCALCAESILVSDSKSTPAESINLVTVQLDES